MGAVQEWHWEPPFLSGTVRTAGGAPINAKIKLGARAFEVENLCVCRQARESGRICPHVLALVFATMQKAQPVAAPFTGASSRAQRTQASACGYIPLSEATDANLILELMVLLPLDLPRAWRANELRIILEGRVAGGAFLPFDVIPKDKTYAVNESDEVLLEEIERIHGGRVPGVWMLPHDDADQFFAALTNHPQVWLGKKSRIEVRGTEVLPSLKLTLEKTGELRLLLSAGGTPDFGNWKFDGKTLTRTPKLPAMFTTGERRLSRTEFAKFYQQELPAWEKMAEVEFSPEFDLLEFEAKPAPTRVTIDGGLTGLNLELHVPAESDWTPDPQNPFRYYRYYIVAKAEIERAGFEPAGNGYRLTSENRVGHFIANILPKWEDNWQVEYGPQFTRFLWLCDRIEPEVAVRAAGNDWLAVDVSYKSDTAVLTNADVARMLQKGAAHHRQANGRIALVPSEAVAGFQDVIFDCQAEQSKTGLRVERKFAPYLAEALRESSLQTKWQVPAEVRSVQPLELPRLLRPYQQDGVNWLHHLSSNGLAGILADEMGLGKTVQALFWLASLKAKPMLVVCPTSLLTNWQSEVARFTPELKTLVLHGADREFEGLTNYDLVITSYALLRRDVAEHQEISWQAVVLDEAQHIKNRFSQIAQAVKELRAKHRLVLTGTPVENSLGDLWSIFDFLMPGYLGPATEFRDRYEKQSSDAATMTRLRQRLRPFVLRRLKNEVAKELPAKIEQITWCELTDEQKSVYQSILAQGRRQVFEEKKESQRRLAVLTTLLRLRQACCHLGLLPGEREWKEPSAKLATFLELIEEAADGNHRVLVFSQFVKLLKLVQEALPVEHCYLDGSTVDRASEIERFQKSKIPVFLISLKAGGTGLNLTGADTVIHLDPWWNPAVEEQATARAHRIGQKQVVTSYKLIAKGTVEEKIVKLQEKKRELYAQTVTSDEAFIQGLTGAELQELLA
ncbi:MAG: RNA polymerase-associated protein RapA [Verrucomicrobiae bacterium]|nr:RNA polymerase-associated protein RapA [Verrucomicrobiae bacterium]